MKPNVMDNVLLTAQTLENTDHTPVTLDDRKSSARALAESFITKRMEAANLAETLKLKSIQKLLDKIDNMSESRLLHIINMLHEMGAKDAEIIKPSDGNARTGAAPGTTILMIGDTVRSGVSAQQMDPNKVEFLDQLFQVAETIVNDKSRQSSSE